MIICASQLLKDIFKYINEKKIFKNYDKHRSTDKKEQLKLCKNNIHVSFGLTSHYYCDTENRKICKCLWVIIIKFSL